MANYAENKFKKIISYILPYGFVWKRQKKVLQKIGANDLVDCLRYLQPSYFDALTAPDGKNQQQCDHMLSMLRMVLGIAEGGEIFSGWQDFFSLAEKVKKFFELIKPYTAKNKNKIRIGGDHDGGYVMLEPAASGIAYSFGVSEYSPWDLEMAEKGFKIFQYDGTIEQNPHPHPNITFNKFNIGRHTDLAAGIKDIATILADNGHTTENNMILQVDIEGAEWELFESMEERQINRFSQIILETHEINPLTDSFPRHFAVLEKIRKTHTPIHVHCNNATPGIFITYSGPIFPKLFEISYARSSDYVFEENTEYYPSKLDMKNIPTKKDIILGRFL